MQDFAPRWLGDDETAVCLGCHAPFDGWNWRHHCRKCGGIFCDACSPYKCLIHPADVVYPPDWDSLLSTFDPREPLRTCAACREAKRMAAPQTRARAGDNSDVPYQFPAVV